MTGAETVSQRLTTAFLDDHQHLTRGFDQLHKMLQADRLEEASRLADELDRVAGPHIQFEEEELYPELARVRGNSYAARLYQEHQSGLHVIQVLKDLPVGRSLDPETKEKLLAESSEALDHAISCGTLLSHLTTLPVDLQERIFDRLVELREEGRRWSELPS